MSRLFLLVIIVAVSMWTETWLRVYGLGLRQNLAVEYLEDSQPEGVPDAKQPQGVAPHERPFPQEALTIGHLRGRSPYTPFQSTLSTTTLNPKS